MAAEVMGLLMLAMRKSESGWAGGDFHHESPLRLNCFQVRCLREGTRYGKVVEPCQQGGSSGSSSLTTLSKYGVELFPMGPQKLRLSRLTMEPKRVNEASDTSPEGSGIIKTAVGNEAV